MARTHDEDLFQSSTMTFGEHLEELRSCLIRASVGLLIGVVIGFLLGRDVVHLIEQPLRRALGDYYISQSQRVVEEWQPRTPDSAGIPYTVEEMTDAVTRRGMSFEIREMHVDRIGRSADEVGGTEGTFPLDTLVPVVLWQPLERDSRVTITTLSAQEAFAIYVKAAIVVGVVLSSPWIFYQLWSFVAAGLYPHEKRYVHVFLPFSTGLFLAGVALAFFFVFDFVLAYLLAFNQWLGLDPDPRITEWLSFVLLLPIGFGIGFQLPLVMLFMERIGIFDASAYASQWRTAVVGIFVVSAILTPADPYSMLFLAVPLCLLYFGGYALCRWLPRPTEPERQLATKANQ